MTALTATQDQRALERALEDLTNEISEALLLDAEIWKHYEKCELQPTHRACALAARAAVSVLLAHDIGQEVGK